MQRAEWGIDCDDTDRMSDLTPQTPLNVMYIPLLLRSVAKKYVSLPHLLLPPCCYHQPPTLPHPVSLAGANEKLQSEHGNSSSPLTIGWNSSGVKDPSSIVRGPRQTTSAVCKHLLIDFRLDADNILLTEEKAHWGCSEEDKSALGRCELTGERSMAAAQRSNTSYTNSHHRWIA